MCDLRFENPECRAKNNVSNSEHQVFDKLPR